MDSALEIAEFIMRNPDFSFRFRGDGNNLRITTSKPGSGSIDLMVGKRELAAAPCNLLLLNLEAAVEGFNSGLAIGDSIQPVRVPAGVQESNAG